ncbi:MAG: hypothetical protein K2K63_04590 [Acetatifactor sp.]|nr:hypothetical protein [Acetatifactor sp.]
MDRFKIMNAFQIKLLLAFLMLLDHLRYIHGLVPPETAAVLTLISRCVAPCSRIWLWKESGIPMT